MVKIPFVHSNPLTAISFVAIKPWNGQTDKIGVLSVITRGLVAEVRCNPDESYQWASYGRFGKKYASLVEVYEAIARANKWQDMAWLTSNLYKQIVETH